MSETSEGPVAAVNTDTHLWPIVSRDYYAPRVFATAEDGIGIDVGGRVIVRPIRDWHALAVENAELKKQLVSVESALRSAFPHFEGDAPITPEAIKEIGKEWTEMVMGWEPQKREIEFSDHDGNLHKIVYESGDSDVGIDDAWVLSDESNLIAPDPALTDDLSEGK